MFLFHGPEPDIDQVNKQRNPKNKNWNNDFKDFEIETIFRDLWILFVLTICSVSSLDLYLYLDLHLSILK